jgi:hypothetical protein
MSIHNMNIYKKLNYLPRKHCLVFNHGWVFNHA